MTNGENPKKYTEQLNLRLRPEEKAALEQRATEAGSSLGEWARSTLLSCVAFSPDYRGLLAEVLAQRYIVLELQTSFAHDGKGPGLDQLKAIVDYAEKTKFVMADKRIAKYTQEA